MPHWKATPRRREPALPLCYAVGLLSIALSAIGNRCYQALPPFRLPLEIRGTSPCLTT